MTTKHKDWSKFISLQMKKQGITKQELSEKSGVAISTIYNICRTNYKGTQFETMERLLEGLDLELCVRRKEK